MRFIDDGSAADYLRQTGRLSPAEWVVIRELAGGVSNMVLLVERPERTGGDFVLKQGRAQLRTSQPWFASLERVWREAEVLRACDALLAEPLAASDLVATVPRILFEDRNEYLFAMSPAPRPHRTWKAELLAGETDSRVARAAGQLLAALHGRSWNDPSLAQRLGDRTLFDQLRVDPYYRTLAEQRPDARAAVARLIESLQAHPCALVHADFSPKNLLHAESQLALVDFETGHFGDPAFDLGFFLSHLVLKAAHMQPDHGRYLALSKVFQAAYNDVLGGYLSPAEMTRLWSRGVHNFAGCVWARLDGKSPVEYLSDEKRREQVRRIARGAFEIDNGGWDDVLQLADREFQSRP